jgi:hypothetical protein
MKARLTTLLCLVALVLAGAGQCPAQDKPAPEKPAQEKPSTVVKVADAVLVRPICFASTVVGSTLFVLGLPISAALKQTKPAADALVVRPAKATFKRPLGDIDAMAD